MASAEEFGRKLRGEVEVVGLDEVGLHITCFDGNSLLMIVMADIAYSSTTEWRMQCELLQFSTAESTCANGL